MAMKTVTLGMTGLEVSTIAFGTWQLGGEWGDINEDEARRDRPDHGGHDGDVGPLAGDDAGVAASL